MGACGLMNVNEYDQCFLLTLFGIPSARLVSCEYLALYFKRCCRGYGEGKYVFIQYGFFYKFFVFNIFLRTTMKKGENMRRERERILASRLIFQQISDL